MFFMLSFTMNVARFSYPVTLDTSSNVDVVAVAVRHRKGASVNVLTSLSLTCVNLEAFLLFPYNTKTWCYRPKLLWCFIFSDPLLFIGWAYCDRGRIVCCFAKLVAGVSTIVWLAVGCFFDADGFGVVLLDCDCLGCFCQVARGLTTVSAGFSMKWGLASSPLRLLTISSATAFSVVYAGPVEASVGGFLSSRGGIWLFLLYLSRHLNNSFTYPATDSCSILLLCCNTWSTYAQYIFNNKG